MFYESYDYAILVKLSLVESYIYMRVFLSSRSTNVMLMHGCMNGFLQLCSFNIRVSELFLPLHFNGNIFIFVPTSYQTHEARLPNQLWKPISVDYYIG